MIVGHGGPWPTTAGTAAPAAAHDHLLAQALSQRHGPDAAVAAFHDLIVEPGFFMLGLPAGALDPPG